MMKINFTYLKLEQVNYKNLLKNVCTAPIKQSSIPLFPLTISCCFEEGLKKVIVWFV